MATGKELFIIRHAKSGWDTVVDDLDRPLTERGVRNAYEMAERLKKRETLPGLLLSSTAARALHTAVIMHREWDLEDAQLEIRPKLYMAEPEEVFQVLAGLPEDVESVAIFGHNPTFTHLPNMFLNTPLDNLPTAGVVHLIFEEGQWSELAQLKIASEWVDYPKLKRR